MKTYVISSVMWVEYRIFEYYLTSLLENQGSLSLILLSLFPSISLCALTFKYTLHSSAFGCRGITSKFPIIVVLHQGLALSFYLFALVMICPTQSIENEVPIAYATENDAY